MDTNKIVRATAALIASGWSIDEITETLGTQMVDSKPYTRVARTISERHADVNAAVERAVKPVTRQPRNSRPAVAYTISDKRRAVADSVFGGSVNDRAVWRAVVKSKQPVTLRDIMAASKLGQKAAESSIWRLTRHVVDGDGLRKCKQDRSGAWVERGLLMSVPLE